MIRSIIVPGSHLRVHDGEPRRIVALVALLTAGLLVGLAGCGSAGPSAGASTPSSNPASAATSNASSPTPTLPTSAQLKAALLTAAELGPGFAASTSSSSSTQTGGTTISGCPALAALINGSPSAGQTSQEAEFTADDTGPYVGESLMTEPAAALDTDYAKTKAALTSCTSLSITSGGVAADFTLTPIQFGDPGAAAVRMDATIQGVQVNGYLALQRLGSVALTFYYFQLASGSSQTAYQYYTQAVTKARSVLGSAAV